MNEREHNAGHLGRVRQRIGKSILEFCHERMTFRADELRRFVEEKSGFTAPGTADRILRDLRKKGLVNYRVVNRRDSLYEVLPLAAQN